MKNLQDEADKRKDEVNAQIKAQHTQANNFKRMMAMSYPKKNIVLGLISALGLGATNPVFAIVFVKMIFGLSVNQLHPLDQVRGDADFYCLMIFIIAICAFFFGLISKFSFGLIGENVTLKIR